MYVLAYGIQILAWLIKMKINVIFKSRNKGPERSQKVRVLDTKPEDLSSISRTRGGRRELIPKSYFLTSMHRHNTINKFNLI